MEKKVEAKHEVNLIDGDLVVSGSAGYGEAVAVQLKVSIGLVDVLEEVANKTKTDKDNKALEVAKPFIEMILKAIENK
jgi:hypothetical protein